jgi:hypothetical protein
LKKCFRDQVEDAVKALESSLSKKMSVHLVNKNQVHGIFLNLLTNLVQHMLKLHLMMDEQFLIYGTVLGAVCDKGGWILSSQFAERLFFLELGSRASLGRTNLARHDTLGVPCVCGRHFRPIKSLKGILKL